MDRRYEQLRLEDYLHDLSANRPLDTHLKRCGDLFVDPETGEQISALGKVYLGYDRDGRKLSVSYDPGGIFARVMTDRLGNALYAATPIANVIRAVIARDHQADEL